MRCFAAGIAAVNRTQSDELCQGGGNSYGQCALKGIASVGFWISARNEKGEQSDLLPSHPNNPTAVL